MSLNRQKRPHLLGRFFICFNPAQLNPFINISYEGE